MASAPTALSSTASAPLARSGMTSLHRSLSEQRHSRSSPSHQTDKVEIRQEVCTTKVSVAIWPVPTICTFYPTVIPCSEEDFLTTTCPSGYGLAAVPNALQAPTTVEPLLPPTISNSIYKHPVVGSDAASHQGLGETEKILLSLLLPAGIVIAIIIGILCCYNGSRRNQAHTSSSQRGGHRGTRTPLVGPHGWRPGTDNGGGRGSGLGHDGSSSDLTSDQGTNVSNASTWLPGGLRGWITANVQAPQEVRIPDRAVNDREGHIPQNRDSPLQRHQEMVEIPAPHGGRGFLWHEQQRQLQGMNSEARP